MTVAFDRVIDGERGVKLHDAGSSQGRLENLGFEVGAHMDFATGLELAARVNHRLVAVVTKRFEQKDFGGSARVAGAEQAGAEDAGGVEDDRVAGRYEIREILECAVLNFVGVAAEELTVAGPTRRPARTTFQPSVVSNT